jgi:4-amino-4-deoxy-L-arabinose transferase-like glycosyltransferase
VGGSESTFWRVHAYSEGVNHVVNNVMFALVLAVLVVAVYAFVHAALQRSDAYTAAEKLTKPVWLIILGVAVAMTSILYPVFGVLGMVIASCAAGVYLVDVRPKLLEIQGKSR